MEATSKLTELSQPDKHATVENVSAILKRKGPEVWSIAPYATVYSAIEIMAARRVGALVVLSDANLVGILSERDYAWRVILMGRSSKETLVKEIMSFPVITCSPEQSVTDCLWTMTAHRVRHLPVAERGRLLGIVSIGDLVGSLLQIQAHTIDQLQTYITNSYPK